MQADILLYNGRILTMEKQEKTFDWLAIKDHKIVDMGEGNDYISLLSNSTIALDVKGGTVMPGFIDSHFHLVQTAMNEESVNLSDVKNFDDIGREIKALEAKSPGECVVGVRLRREKLEEGDFPNRLDLDKISNNSPIWINCHDYQVSMLNTYGLLYYQIPFRMDGVELDGNGVATGVFKGKANATLRTRILDQHTDIQRRDTISALIPRLMSKGITTINAMEGGYMYSNRDADFVHQHSKDFSIDIALFYQSIDPHKVLDKRLNRIGGCLYVDGTIGARTAALSFDYKDKQGERGILKFSQAELNDFVEECYANRLQLSLYTIGDRAVELALNAHEYAFQKTGILGLRHRLEHVVMATKEQIRRAKELGIIFSMNPTYERYWGGEGGMYNERMGDKYKETNKFKAVLEEGVTLCGGSDSDVCEYNPFLGIHSAVNHPVPENRIPVYEALKMYTVSGAYAIFQENEKGTLSKGKLADVIVLDRDVMNTPTEKLQDTEVVCTIKSGEILYNMM